MYGIHNLSHVDAFHHTKPGIRFLITAAAVRCLGSPKPPRPHQETWKQVYLLRKSKTDLPREFLQYLGQSLSEAEAGKQEEDIEKSLTAAQKAAAEHSDNPALLAALGTALNKAGDYPAATLSDKGMAPEEER